MLVAIGASVDREFELLLLSSLYENLDLNVPSRSIPLHGAVTHGIQLSRAGCVLERTDSRTAESLGRLGAMISAYRNRKKEIDMEDILAKNTLPPNDCPTFEEPQGTEEGQVRADREARNESG